MQGNSFNFRKYDYDYQIKVVTNFYLIYENMISIYSAHQFLYDR